MRLVAFVTLMTCAVDVHAQPGRPGGSRESLVKAGYVYNFANLVEWPASVAPEGRPLVIGVLGNNEFARVLAGVVRDKTSDDRLFVVKPVKRSEIRECGCRILFVAASEEGPSADILQLQKSGSVLTIADAPDFARRGGIVGFTLQKNKIRFVVNVDAAAQASLSISSRLLALATIVRPGR